MGHEILARMAAGIGEAIGKPVRLRQQHEPHIVVDERRHDHQIRLATFTVELQEPVAPMQKREAQVVAATRRE